MATESKEVEVFDIEYVKELREEAAGWRTKFRELEGKLAAGEVEKELMKRGVSAESDWVKVAAGQSVSEAVDSFVEKYPHLVSEPSSGKKVDELKQDKRKMKVAPMGSGSPKSNSPGPEASGRLDRNIEEIKKDPKARAALRDQYRQLLAQSSHQSNGE